MSDVEFPAVIDSKIGAALGRNFRYPIRHYTGCSSNSNPAKVDIESAFKIIPVSPLDRPLLGFHWKGKFFMDAVLPMGVVRSLSFQYKSGVQLLLESISELLNKLGRGGVVTGLWVTLWRNDGPTCL